MELNDKIIIYQTIDGQTSIEVKLENEIMVSANQMVTLFDRDEKTIENISIMSFLKVDWRRITRVDVKNNLTPSCEDGRDCCSRVVVSAGEGW